MEAVDHVTQADLDAVSGDVSTLTGYFSSVSQKANTNATDIEALEGRVDALEASEGGSGGGVDASEITRLEGLITAAQTKANDAMTKADGNVSALGALENAVDGEVADLESLISTAQAKADGADTKASANAVDIESLGGRVDALEANGGSGSTGTGGTPAAKMAIQKNKFKAEQSYTSAGWTKMNIVNLSEETDYQLSLFASGDTGVKILKSGFYTIHASVVGQKCNNINIPFAVVILASNEVAVVETLQLTNLALKIQGLPGGSLSAAAYIEAGNTVAFRVRASTAAPFVTQTEGNQGFIQIMYHGA